MSSGLLSDVVASAGLVPFGGPQVVVVDTNVLFSDLVRRVRHDQDTVLVRAGRTGAIRLFAGTHVYTEFYERVCTLERRGLPKERAIKEFESHYLPIIRFVDRAATPHPRAAVVEDVGDVPTAELGIFLAPALIYSEDSDLTGCGFGRVDWLTLTFRAEDALGADLTFWLFGMLMRGGARRIRAGADAVRSTVSTPSGALAAGALIVLVAVAMSRPGRRDAVGQAMRNTRGVAGDMAMVFGQIALQRGEGASVLLAAAVEPDTVRPLEQRIAQHLARGPAMTVEQIVARLHLSGTQVESSAVMSELENQAAFVSVGALWSIGRRLGPASAQWELDRSDG